MGKFRPNAAALLVDQEGKILICERKNKKGAWQFPQGGFDDEEEAIDALFREVYEEVGLAPQDYDIVEYREGYRYIYPNGKQLRKGYKGQEQTYFLCRMKKVAKSHEVRIDSKEFQDYRWIEIEDFKLSWLPKFKEEVYAQVFWDFFGVELCDIR